MKKHLLAFPFCTILLCSFCPAFSQWTRITELPASNIFSLFHNDTVFYAGGTNVVYTSRNKGVTWTETAPVPGLSPATSLIDHIIAYKNELYISSPKKDGIFKSVNGGLSWLNISEGLDTLTEVMGFAEFKGDLYIATAGSFARPVYKLDAGRTHWLSFNDGLSGLSSNVNCIAATSSTLVTGTNANALFDYLAPNTNTWEERFLLNQISPNEAAFDIITANDTLYLPGKSGKFYMSTDKGLNWNLFATRLPTGNTTIVNAKQALITSRYIFDGVQNITLFYFIKKDSLQTPLQNFSIVNNHFTWRMAIVGGMLWDASDGGLFFMNLNDLPGITQADDFSNVVVLPLRFVSVDASCKGEQVVISWKTEGEQNSTFYGVERSPDSMHWTEIGSLTAKSTGGTETTYAFSDTHPLQAGYYRIVEHDANGRLLYSSLVRAGCVTNSAVRIWPNPVYDRLYINVTAEHSSQFVLKLFDSKAALIKVQKAGLSIGINQITMDLQLLSTGIYSLIVDDGQMHETIRVVKQL